MDDDDAIAGDEPSGGVRPGISSWPLVVESEVPSPKVGKGCEITSGGGGCCSPVLLRPDESLRIRPCG